MDLIYIVAILAVVAILITWFFTKKSADSQVSSYKNLAHAINNQKELLALNAETLARVRSELESLDKSLSDRQSNIQDLEKVEVSLVGRVNAAQASFDESELKLNELLARKRTLEQIILIESEKLHRIQNDYKKLSEDTEDLQALKGLEADFLRSVNLKREELIGLSAQVSQIKEQLSAETVNLHELMSKLDLYSRIEEFIDNGFFEIPDYLYETSERFSLQIAKVRGEQKELISSGKAITYPQTVQITADKTRDKKILDGQIRLMLSAFNIECDLLMGKINPSSYVRTLERIEKLANALEKSAASLHCGFNIKYVELKFEECTLQYQFSLKRQEEQEEQRLIREQIREEQKALREYEAAIAQTEKEEKIYKDLLLRAREELGRASLEEKAMAEQRIFDLERQLQDAEFRNERAKSMAEQTRKGHVYVISNIGSFGENIYKIGLTRRLDPMDRVKELGDASVPFTFDVHAMIYVEDAPALEAALHREFSRYRVNAVNFRKEFFRVSLDAIRRAVENIAGVDAEFKITALAEQFYESKRLQNLLPDAECMV